MRKYIPFLPFLVVGILMVLIGFSVYLGFAPILVNTNEVVEADDDVDFCALEAECGGVDIGGFGEGFNEVGGELGAPGKFKELPRRTYSKDAKIVPILMYHHIEKPPTKEEQPNENVRDLYVSPAMFNRQMQYLYLAGYQTISLTDLSRALRKDTKLPEKPVIITFDDLVPTQVTKGIPVLKKYGFKAIFFVNIDSGYTTGSRVNTIIKAGHEIGSHSYHHVDLRGRNDSFLMVETLRSKEVLEEKYEIKVTHFAYPGCNYDHKAENAVKDAGYDTAVICASAQNGHILSERWHLARRVISNDFDLFVARLEDREGVY